MKLSQLAVPVIPTAATSFADFPWYAWLAATMAGLALAAWQYHLDHAVKMKELEVRDGQINSQDEVKLKALDNLDKVRNGYAADLIAAIGEPPAGAPPGRWWSRSGRSGTRGKPPRLNGSVNPPDAPTTSNP